MSLKTKVICVSIPRSGHHLLMELLSDYLEDFRYCEYYTPEDCCRSIPCSREGMNLQKYHDFDLDLEQNDRWHYIVQYRHPIYSAISDFELVKKVGKRKMGHTRQFWYSYLLERRNFWCSFIRKWIIHQSAMDVIVVPYEEMTASPHLALFRLLRFFGLRKEIDFERIDAVINKRQVRQRRRLEEFVYYDPLFFHLIERSMEFEMKAAGVPRHLPVESVRKVLDGRPSERHVRLVFHALLQRQPARAGIDHYLEICTSVDDLIRRVLSSREFGDIQSRDCRYNDRVRTRFPLQWFDEEPAVQSASG